MLSESGVSTVLLPVNFGNMHWCGIMINICDSVVTYYDSVNSPKYHKALDVMAWSIYQDVLTGFRVVSANCPIQCDGFSCGVFVCLLFWRNAGPMMSKDMTIPGLACLRFKLLHYLLTGNQIYLFG